MNYSEAINYLNSFQFSLKGFDLEDIRQLIKSTKMPVEKLNVVHIAGTNGKGSAVAFVSSILREQGYNVGSYTSPHLLSVRERIKINNKKIPKKDFASLMDYLLPFISIMEKRPSYFELLTAAAILYFLDKKVDWVVAETGLGGRLDATKVMPGGICAFTDISLEHTETLGNTIRKIASEKAGIIKENSFVVIDKKNKGARVIEAAASEKNCRIINPKVKAVKITKDYSIFNSIIPEIKNLKIKLIGFHQLENAAIASGIIEALREQGVKVSDNAIRRGFLKAELPGRMHLVKKAQLILLDAAHTPDSCKKLVKSLKLFKFNKLVLVFACLNDKDAKEMLKEFHWGKLIISKVKNERAMLPERIRKFAKGKGIIIEPVADAIREAEKIASKNDLILIAGSGYAVSEAIEYFKIKI